MRVLGLALLLLVGLVNFDIWVDHDGMPEVWRLRQAIAAQELENETLRERNRHLAAEVVDLKQGIAAVEELARRELGMVGPGETFFLYARD